MNTMTFGAYRQTMYPMIMDAAFRLYMEKIITHLKLMPMFQFQISLCIPVYYLHFHQILKVFK